MSESLIQMQRKLADVTSKLENAEGELAEAQATMARLREQKPVAYRIDWPLGLQELEWQPDSYDEDYVESRGLPNVVPLYAAPVPAVAAPAVPDWNVNIERIRDVMHMLGISIEESVECFSAALPTNINRMTLAMKRHLQKLAGMTAAPAPSVPEEWREKLIAEFPLFNDEGLCQEKHHCEWALQQDRKRLHALLQSEGCSSQAQNEVRHD